MIALHTMTEDASNLARWSKGKARTMTDKISTPLTPAIRTLLRDQIDSQIEDLKTCDRNVFTDLQLASVKVSRAILDVLPDGTPVQIDRRSK